MISREQLVRRLRDAGWHFSSETKRVHIFRRSGHPQRINVACRDQFPESAVRVILTQAGLRPREIEEFLLGSVKN
jgi:nucleotide-binding universal stress UspA family protein